MLPTIKQIREANGGLDNLTDFEIAQYQHQKYARYVPDFNRFAQLVGVDPGSKWGNRLSASIDNYQANMAGVAEAVTGSETMRDVRLSNQRDARNAQQFAQNQGAVMSYKDVDGVGDALDYVGGLAVDSAPYIAESLVGGLAVRGLSTGLRGTIAAGRAADASADAVRAGQAASKALATRATLGGVAASYPSAVGDILQSQRDETGTTDLGMAAMGGVPYAALNAVGLEGAAARGTLPRAGLDLLNRGLDGAQGVKGVVARTGVNALKAAVPEGLSETGQEMINQSFGRMAVNPDQTLFNPEANERYLESFVGGAALGGAFGGAAGGWRRSEGYQAPVAPIDETGGVNLLTGERLNQPARGLQLGYDPTAGNDRLITFPDGTTAFPEDVPERRAQLAAQDHPGYVERQAEYPDVPLVSIEQAALAEDKAKIEARNAAREEAKGLGISGSKGLDLYLELKQALDDGVISEAAFREARVQLGERKNNQVARFVKAAYAVDEAAKAGKAQLEADAITSLNERVARDRAQNAPAGDGPATGQPTSDLAPGAAPGLDRDPAGQPGTALSTVGGGQPAVSVPAGDGRAGAVTVAGVPADKTVTVGRSDRKKQMTPAQVLKKIKSANPRDRMRILAVTGMDMTTDPTTGAPKLVVVGNPMSFQQIADEESRATGKPVSRQAVAQSLAAFGINESVATQVSAGAVPDTVSNEELGITRSEDGDAAPGFRVEEDLSKAAGQGLVNDTQSSKSRELSKAADEILAAAGQDRQGGTALAPSAGPSVTDMREGNAATVEANLRYILTQHPERDNARADWGSTLVPWETLPDTLKADWIEQYGEIVEQFDGDLNQAAFRLLDAVQANIEDNYRDIIKYKGQQAPTGTGQGAITGDERGQPVVARAEEARPAISVEGASDAGRVEGKEQAGAQEGLNAEGGVAARAQATYLDAVKPIVQALQRGELTQEQAREQARAEEARIRREMADEIVEEAFRSVRPLTLENARSYAEKGDMSIAASLVLGEVGIKTRLYPENDSRVQQLVAERLGVKVEKAAPKVVTKKKRVARAAVSAPTWMGPSHPDYEAEVRAPVLQALAAGNYSRATLKDGKTVRLVELADPSDGSSAIHAYAPDGKLVGDLVFSRVDPRSQPAVDVSEEYRRLGVASALYDAAEKTGWTAPALEDANAVRTEDGQAFRRARSTSRPQMSVAEGGSSTEASILEEINTLMPVNRQKVVVVQSVSQLPRFAQQSLAEEGPQGKKVQAFVLNGKAYLIADNIRPGSARSVFLHEVGVHMGLEDILSGKEFLRLAGKIRSWADSNDGSRESELARRAVNRVGNAGTQDEQVLSELVAYFVEEAVSAGVNPTAMDYKSDLGRWMRSLISALKAGLAKLGLVDAKGLTAQDVVDMAYGAAQLEMQSDIRADDGSGSFQASVATQLGPQYAKGESGVKQAMADLKTAAVKYGAFTRDLIDQAAKYMPAASDYLKKYEAVAIDRTKMEQQVDAVLERFSELNAAERAQVNSLIRSSTMDKVWAFKPEWLTDAQAGFDRQSSQAVAFAAMTPAQQAVVRDVFKHGYDTLKQMQDAVTNNVNSEFDALIKGFRDAGNEAEAVKAEGRKKQALQEFRTMLAMNGNWPYAPLRRFGDHVVVAKSAAYLEAERQGDRKAISEMEADENHYYVEFFESRREARAAVADMQSRGRYPGGTVENFNKGDASDQLYGGRDTFNAFRRLRNLVNESGSTMDAAANTAINKLMNDLYLTLLGERSARQAERNRKNTAGADRDMMRAFATKGRADAHFIAALRNGGEVQELLVEMKKQADQGTSGTRELRREFFNEILARHTMAMDFQSTPVVDKVMAFTSFFQLMVNPAYYLQNIMQPWVMTLPMLAGKFGYARAWREMSRAYRDLAPLLKDGRFTKGDYDALPADVREVVKQLAARGRIEISLEHDLGAWRSNDAGNVASRTLSTVESKLRKANQTVEMVNRLATAITAARLEPAASAVDYADRVIIATHGDYNAFNAPRLMRTRLGRLATQFRKFQLIQITMYTKLIADAFNGASADERAVARRILAFNLGHMAGLAGAVGLPGFQFFSMVLGAAFGDDDEPDDPEATMRRILGNGPVADALIRGVPNMMGVDLSGKVGSGGMLSLFPYADWDFSSRDGYSKLVLAALGPFIGGMMPRWAEGLGHMQDGDYYKGLEKFLPGALGNAIKGARLSTEGVTTTRGDLVMGPEEVSWVDGLFQAAGLPTKTLTERSFLASAEFKASRFFNERSSEIKRAYVEAFEGNDAAGLEQARRDWQDMQATRKRLGLAPQPMSQLIRAPMEKRRREAAAVGGVAADKQTEGFVRNLME